MLTERRAIKKLLDKIRGTDPKKEAIVKYFLYLVRKYGKNIDLENGRKKLNQNAANGSSNTGLDNSGISTQECFSPTDTANGRYDDQNNLSGAAIPPTELCCPMSLTLMHDPVIIATGQTYERENIERWFNEGNDTCPATQLKLQNFTITPNTCMKAVICNWCNDQPYLPEKIQSYSVSCLNNVSAPLITEKSRGYMVDYSSSSFGSLGASDTSSLTREAEQSKSSFGLFYSNANYQLYYSFCNFDEAMFLGFFHDLSELPVELQTKAVKDLKNVLNGKHHIWHSMLSNGFLGAFHEFLKNKSSRYTMQALKAGILFFLAFLSCGRSITIPLITEDVVRLAASFLDSELRMEVLLILHELFPQPSCRNSSAVASAVAHSVFGALDTGDTKCLELALKIITKISSDKDIKSYLVCAGIITKLSPLLAEGIFTECCLNILRNLSEVKEALKHIIRTGQCLSCISDYLDTGSCKEREYAAVILLAVCSFSVEYCSLLMKEGIIPALFDLTVTGTRDARECASKLLLFLRDFKRRDQFSSSCSREVANDNVANNLPSDTICKQPMSMSARYISRKINIFSKVRSVTLSEK